MKKRNARTIAAFLLALVLGAVPVGFAWAGDLAAGSADDEAAEQSSAYDKQTTKMDVDNVKGRVIANGYYTIEWAGDSSLLVGVRGDSKKTNVKVALCTEHAPAKSQEWKFKYNYQNDTYTITNRYSKKALTAAKAKIGSKVVQRTLKSGLDKRQRWRVVATSAGYSLINYANEKVRLTVSAAKENGLLKVNAKKRGLTQRFWLHPAVTWKPSATVIRDGVYTIASAADPDAEETLLLGVPGSLSKAKANFTLFRNKGKLSQMFRITKVKSPAGYYKIQDINSSLYLTSMGAKVVQKKYTAKKTQLWKPLLVDGALMFVNGYGRALDVATATARLNSKAAVAKADEEKATQKWAISPTTTGLTYACERGLEKANTRAAAKKGHYQWSGFQKYFITADLTAFELNIFKRTKLGGPWVPYKQWSIACGKNKCTRPADKVIYRKWEYHGDKDGYRAWYWTTIGNTAFHSQLCHPYSQSIYDYRTKGYISEGCIRMSMSNAKWIYYNMPIGTFVSRYY